MTLKEWAVIGAIVLGVVAYQKYEIYELTDSVATLTTTVGAQKTEITNLNTSVTGLVQNDANQSNDRIQRDKSDQKVRSDTANQATFAKRPGLLQDQINASFNKFAKEFEDLTK